ncbi:hypothetical protein M1N59_01180 [Dehalococcoidales bacterium]|nr:hypothetical protein [Dehalococcoidales bacterium]
MKCNLSETVALWRATMKEEELIKKLESVKLPSIEIQSHRRQLKMALLNADYLQRRPGVTTLGLAKSKVKGGIEMIRGLVSPQPVWKTVVAGVLAVALIAGLAIVLSSLTGQSPEALAAEIAKQNPRVQVFLLEGATLKEVVAEGELQYKVILEDTEYTEKGQEEVRIMVAYVELGDGKITLIERGHLPSLTEEQKERAIEIAKGDPSVQEFINIGATIHKVTPLPSWSPLGEEPPDTIMAGVSLVLEGEEVQGTMLVEVNLTEEMVVSVTTWTMKIAQGEKAMKQEDFNITIIKEEQVER